MNNALSFTTVSVPILEIFYGTVCSFETKDYRNPPQKGDFDTRA